MESQRSPVYDEPIQAVQTLCKGLPAVAKLAVILDGPYVFSQIRARTARITGGSRLSRRYRADTSLSSDTDAGDQS